MPANKAVSHAADLIDAYATKVVRDTVLSDVIPPVILAIRNAASDSERCHLGRALLDHHQAINSRHFRIGGGRCDPELVAIAKALDYMP